MKRKALLLTLVICLFFSVLSPGLVQAAGPTVLSSSTDVNFPASLRFNLSATSDANIVDIRLRYQVDHIGFAQVTSEVFIEFVPATRVSVNWNWDMRRTGGLPPGAAIDYWWTVTDATGNKVETQPARLAFEDKRYAWRSLTRDKVTLYWYQGDDAFGGRLMTAAQEALSRLAGITGAALEKPVRIYIYASSRDLQGSMIFPQEWTGGVAFTEYGTIAIGIGPNQLEWGTRTLAHEFSHLIIHQMVLNPYSELPTWLDEGLAMYNEGPLEGEFASFLRDAIARDRLISVRSLASPFSAFAGEALLAYAQSFSIIEFLIKQYGEAKMFELLTTFKQGSTYDGALLKVYNFDMDGLNTLWREYVGLGAQPAQATERTGISPVLIVAIALFVAGFLFGSAWLIIRQARRRKP